MSMAIKYNMQKKAKGGSVGNGCAAGCDCAKCMAKGGMVGSQHDDYDVKGVHKSGSGGLGESTAGGLAKVGAKLAAKGDRARVYGEAKAGDQAKHASRQLHQQKLSEIKSMKGKDRKYLAEGGLVDSVMKSRGGEIANDDTAENPKAEENQFDELVETGGLESHIDADQQQGNDQEDQDRRDIVSMVMNTRKKRG